MTPKDEMSEDPTSYEDFFEEEILATKEMFDLEKILVFQTKHDVQIIRGDDYEYMCYIDKKVYAAGITPMFALVYGIKKYSEL